MLPFAWDPFLQLRTGAWMPEEPRWPRTVRSLRALPVQ